jgi:hypothetical protein
LFSSLTLCDEKFEEDAPVKKCRYPRSPPAPRRGMVPPHQPTNAFTAATSAHPTPPHTSCERPRPVRPAARSSCICQLLAKRIRASNSGAFHSCSSKFVGMSNSSPKPHSQTIATALDDGPTSTLPLAQQVPEGQRPKRLTLKVSCLHITGAAKIASVPPPCCVAFTGHFS